MKWGCKKFGNSGENIPVNIVVSADFAKWCPYVIRI